MKRRKFIQHVSLFTGGLLLSRNNSFAILSGTEKISGTILSAGKG